MKALRTAAVLGSGAVGGALLRALPGAGVRVLSAWTRGSGLPLPALDVEVVFLAVPDDAVEPLCEELPVQRGQLIAHLAGALPLSSLASAARRGARTGSLHPLRAFVRGGAQDFRGAAAGVAGQGALARSQLAALARRLGMTPLAVGDGSRALYHAAAVLAAGSQVALFAEAVRAFRAATGASEPAARRALLPLALGSLEALRDHPPGRALTGPVARGDAARVAAHLAALPKDLAALYRLLGEASLRLARAGKRAPPARLAQVARALRVL